MKTKMASYRLPAETTDKIKELAALLNVSQAQIVEWSVRVFEISDLADIEQESE